MKKIYLLVLGAFLIMACDQDHFNIENTNQADAIKVLATAADFQNFNTTNHTTLFQTQIGFYGIYMRGYADQFSTTNAFRGFWGSCDQPRRQINNSTSNDDLVYYPGGPWNGYNGVIGNANIVIRNIEIDGNTVAVNGVDVTNQELAGAYFDKGLAQGYLSMIYDKAYIVNPDTDLTALEFSSYTDMLNAAIANLQKAIDLASGSFTYSIYTNGPSLDAASFKQLVYSYMARFSMAVARTDAEAQTLDYNTILGYLNNGITSDFYPVSSENVLFNNLQDWSLFVLGDTAGYMPTDIKIQHLFDPTYPTDYPTDETIILGQANSTDPRTSYYEYVGSNFGFLRASRGRYLFSSYKHVRFFDGNNENQSGLPLQLFPKAEIDYLKAECYYRMGDYAQAKAMFDASPRMTVGGQTTTASQETIRNVLLYENSIELDLNCGMAVSWAFMRRHDLLQAGTPTMYPIPASELEITQDDIYTFGGPSAAGQEGTASGARDWRTLTLTY